MTGWTRQYRIMELREILSRPNVAPEIRAACKNELFMLTYAASPSKIKDMMNEVATQDRNRGSGQPGAAGGPVPVDAPVVGSGSEPASDNRETKAGGYAPYGGLPADDEWDARDCGTQRLGAGTFDEPADR